MNGSGGRVAQVTDVLERLLEEFDVDAGQRPVLFQAALRVCAEESRRTKRGQAAAPLEVLVARAREQLVPLPLKRRQAPPQGTPEQEPLSARPEPMAAPETIPESLAGLPSLRAEGEFDGDLAAVLARFDGDAEPGAPGPGPEIMPLEASAPSDAPSSETDDVGDLSSAPAEERGGGRPPGRLRLALLAAAVVAGLAYLVFHALGSGARPSAVADPIGAVRSGQYASNPTGPGTRPAGSQASPPASPGVATRPAVPGPPAGQAETMASPDWVGREPTYAVHFSSYREKRNAERDATRVERQYGMRAHAVRVTIQGQGEFYRVIAGGFESAAAARSFMAQHLAERAAVSPIYWVVPPP